MSLRWIPTVLIVVLLVCVGRTPGGDEDAVKKELKKLEGQWKLVSGERNGKPTDRFDGSTLTIRGDSFEVQQDGKDVFKANIQVDPSKKPKALDLKIIEGEEKDKTVLGIYAVDGDDLKITFGKPGETTRPTEFATKDGGTEIAVVMKRDKK